MSDYPTAVSGRGAEIIAADGRRYIDGSGGAAVSCLGHSHPVVIEAVRRQLECLSYVHGSFFTTEVAEELADVLVASAPAGLSHCYFVSGGSEAIESAVKLARQYAIEIGEPRRTRLIARRQSYHGNTRGALALGANAGRRAPFEPLLTGTSHVSACFAFHGKDARESSPDYVARLVRELESEIVRLGPDTVLAFVAETVVGATAGAVAAEPGYFASVRALCDRYGVLLILDEVMCGMGRCGTLHACEAEGVRPDIMTLAKGLGGGYVPIGALLIGEHIVAALEQGSGVFVHGFTYNDHALACAAALAVQRVIVREDLLANVVRQGNNLSAALSRRLAEHRFVGDIRGRGLFWAVELVADRRHRTPFDPRLKLHARIKAQAMSRGLLVYPSGGCVDGVRGDHVLIAPPFIADAPLIEEIVARLGEAIDAAVREIHE